MQIDQEEQFCRGKAKEQKLMIHETDCKVLLPSLFISPPPHLTSQPSLLDSFHQQHSPRKQTKRLCNGLKIVL